MRRIEIQIIDWEPYQQVTLSSIQINKAMYNKYVALSICNIDNIL